MHILQSDSPAIVINPYKTLAGEYIHRFNAPALKDAVGIMVGDRTATSHIAKNLP